MAETNNNNNNSCVTELHFIDNPSRSDYIGKLSKFKLFRKIAPHETMVGVGFFNSRIIAKNGVGVHSFTVTDRHVVYRNSETLDFPVREIPDRNNIPVRIDMDLKVRVSDPVVYYARYNKNEQAATADVISKADEFLREEIGRYSFEEMQNYWDVRNARGATVKEYIMHVINRNLDNYFYDTGLDVQINSFKPPQLSKTLEDAEERRRQQTSELEMQKAEAAAQVEIARKQAEKNKILAEQNIENQRKMIESYMQSGLTQEEAVKLASMFALSGSNIGMFVNPSDVMGSSEPQKGQKR